MDIKEIFPDIEADTVEKFNEQFNKRFILRDAAPKDPEIRKTVSGSLLGSTMTNLYKKAKDEGVDFTEDEKKEIQKNEDLFEAVLKKMRGQHVNQIDELKTKIGKGDDERLKQLEADLEKERKRASDLDAARQTAISNHELYKTETEQRIKASRIEQLRAKEWDGVKVKATLTEVEKMGLQAAIQARLKFELNDKEELEVFTPTGERIMNKNTAGAFEGPKGAMQQIVDELGLSEINPRGGQPAPSGANYTPSAAPGGAPTGRKIISGGKIVEV